MTMKRILAAMMAMLFIFGVANAESFKTSALAGMGYSKTQWLSNDTSRALLVCTAVRDYCDSGSGNYKKLAEALKKNRSYICCEDDITVYISHDDKYLALEIEFSDTAKKAKAYTGNTSDMDHNSGEWYTVSPSDCKMILNDE